MSSSRFGASARIIAEESIEELDLEVDRLEVELEDARATIGSLRTDVLRRLATR